MEYLEKVNDNLSCLIDWIGFTITDAVVDEDGNIDVDKLLGDFGLDISDFVECSHGGSGYRKMMIYAGANIKVLYDGSDGMGVHIDVSGSAIADFFVLYRESCCHDRTPFGTFALDWEMDVVRDFFRKVLEHGHFTRLDLSVDNKCNIYYYPWQLFDLWNGGFISSKFRKANSYKSSDDSGVCVGDTIYFGSMSSELFLRVYNKKLEQNYKYKNTKKEPVKDEWVRWEFQIRKEHADGCAKKIVEGVELGQLVFGLLSNYIRIINKDDARKTRCSTNIKWLDFIQNVERLSIYIKKENGNLETKKEWVKRQVMPTLAALIVSDGDLSFFLDNLPEYALRWKKYLRKEVEKINPDWMLQLKMMYPDVF